MSKLPCNQKIDMSVDRGRILPLGGNSNSNSGFQASTGKTVDGPNAYKHFSRRTARASKSNDSELTPRNGAMSAFGENSFRNGKRPLPPTQGGSNSFMNDEQLTPRAGLRMTGMEKRIVDQRTFNEDHPRKLVKKVQEPVRPALDEQGRTPFITGNGMIGKFGVSPAKARKNSGTEQADMDTRNAAKRQAIVDSGLTPQRYQSPFRAVATDRARSPANPESLPLHPEIDKCGTAKVQRFANGALRHKPSLSGVFNTPAKAAPPPYKLVAPFHTSD